ncbi:PqiB family protein [Flavimaricola marinus]|uniref:Paraquat-inducible protein B n=1 Tax=Flavimaricola marinus TaxID=1819565 RepID=A0A238LII5_9RHOB|nr:MlaD family protein [Flavimaricola marinus]SMY09537.1 Paraquat-inducible protein B [Flavimaricola marinus]
MNDQIPDVTIASSRRSLWDRASVVWLVPFAALAIALGVAWQTYNDRGPLIEIVFDNAAGVAKGETELRYRDVAIGLVETVKFTEALDQVIVGVRVDKDVAPYVDAESEFWVVRPEVTTQGVSGLDTVLSGVYLQGNWDDRIGEPQSTFEGLADAPLLVGGQQGLSIVLRSNDGSLSGNTPILYKGVEVGQVGTANVSSDGFSVEAVAVVYSPYDNLVTDQTRFWDTSGFSLSIGTSGAAVDFESLASLIAGGVTFDTFVSGASLARDDTTFTVYGDAGAARASIFDRSEGATVDIMAIFDGNVSGLVTGAAVELNGLRIGEVSGLNGVIEETPSGSNFVRLQTILSIQPSRLGLDGATNAEDALTFLQEQVDQGLRARLVSGSILTGGLKVQLASVANVPPASMNINARPFPIIPVADSEISDVSLTAQGALDRLNELPIEELLQSATDFLSNASVLVGSAETQQVPADISALLAEIRTVVGSPAIQSLPDQLGNVMTDLETTMSEVRVILTAVQEQEVVNRVASAVDAVTGLTSELETTIEGVPALLAEIEALAAKANGLPLEELLVELSALSANANGLIGADATQALPAQIGQVTAELEGALAEVQTLVADLNANAATTRLLDAVDAAAATAASLDASFAGVPDLVARISVVAEEAQGMDLATLTSEITALVASADSLVSSEATQALPSELNAALSELQTLLVSVNGNDTVVRLLAAVDAATVAAEGVTTSVEGVPQLIENLNAVAADAQGLELDALIDRVTSLVASADTLLADEGTQALPAELTASLAELRSLMAELSDGGAIENTNAALLSARNAADEIAAAAETLPALLNRANALLGQANTTLSGFEDTSPAIRDARAALQEVARAAEAVASLARAIERRPNSLLVGR